ncbi:MAG: Flp pilus assembly complex ATPase component TadA [Bdellovibrionaceae bacterium]|nr:Flp pilus assembly complex ATPase component TadA [Pseudobdellovibrionaceae bacterium]
MLLSPGCNVIAVGGGKGGVGKSVFSANFALALMMELKTQVLLIDADARSCGDQNVILGVRPNKTIAELAAFQGSLTPASIPQMVTQLPSGLSYIGAVRGPDETLKVNPEAFMKPLEFLSRHFKYIIIDVGTDYGPLQTTLIQESTALMILTVPEVLVVNQTLRMIQELLVATMPQEMFQLVINKVGPGALSPQAISQTLRMPALGLIPQDDATTAMSLSKSTPFVIGARQAPITAAYHDLVRKLTGGTLQKLKSVQKPQGQVQIGQGRNETVAAQKESAALIHAGQEELDPRNVLKLRVHGELIRAMDLKKGVADTNGDPQKEEALRQKTLAMITTLVDKESPNTARDERSRIIKEVLEESLGLGPLEDLLADPAVTEIMVNGYKRIFIEKSGKIQLSPTTFTSNHHLRNVIERIVTPLGRRIDEKTPYVDARLRDGSRVNAIIEPLSIDGPALTIRKFKKGGITPEKYMEFGSVSKPMLDFLKICVENGLNVVISGGTGSGKTSLLNMISGYIPATERIVTVEDAAELQMKQEHVVRLETRPANMEGTGAVTIRDLVKNSLRMRPDRIVVGETRDGAALDMLQAMNTGHDGSMTTTHANSPRECTARLETLCLMAGMDLPVAAIREQIASAVHIIVQISRLSDGSRKVISITEVCGLQGGTITMQEIFRFKETGFDKNRKIVGVFQAMGLIPSFIEKLEQKGVIIPRDMFSNEPPKPAAQAAPKTSLMPTMPGMKKIGGK